MVIGHQKILEFFQRSIQKQQLSHAYLFTGPAHLGKKTAAQEFIKMLGGQEIKKDIHPDILIVEPEMIEKKGIKKEAEISIDQVRQIQHQLSLCPYQAPYKIALIDQAERMTREAANALLKTLEEPTPKTILILISSQPQLLLPTIISRCQIIKFLPVPLAEIEKSLIYLMDDTRLDDTRKGVMRTGFRLSSINLKSIIRLSAGRPGLVIRYLNNPQLLQEQKQIINRLEHLIQTDINQRYQYAEEIAKDVAQARQTLNTWLLYFRDLLLVNVGCPEFSTAPNSVQSELTWSSSKIKNIIQNIQRADLLLGNSSINARLVLENLMLEL